MTKGLGSTLLTASAQLDQRIWWAVAISYSTTLRLTSWPRDITIAGQTFYAWGPDANTFVSEITNSQGIIERVSIKANNGDATVTGAYSGYLSALVKTTDPKDIPCQVFRVYEDVSGNQQQQRWFFGKIVSANADEKTVTWHAETATDLSALPGNNVSRNRCRYKAYKDSYCGFTGARTDPCKRTREDCQTMVFDPVQTTGSGLDDISSRGDFTGAQNASEYRVRISTAGTPDKYKFSRYTPEGTLLAAEGSEVSITGGWQSLTLGVEIQFAATTGHTLNDVFTVAASNARRYGDCAHAPVAGTTITIQGRQQTVSQGPRIYRNIRRLTEGTGRGSGIGDVELEDKPTPTRRGGGRL